MDKRYAKVQEAGKQVPEGWIPCSESLRTELKAFVKGENDKFFPGSWLMTADQLAEAQATGYTLSNVAETSSSSSSSSSGNALGTGTPNPNANSNDADGTGNVPDSAQGTGSSLTVSSSTNANEDPPSARLEAEEETADYEEEE